MMACSEMCKHGEEKDATHLELLQMLVLDFFQPRHLGAQALLVGSERGPKQ